MGFGVKNTTKCGLIDLLCPHACRGCGQLGEVLCERCKKYMLMNRVVVCPVCKSPLAEVEENVENIDGVMRAWMCGDCDLKMDGMWSFGCREGVLEKLVEEYKYNSVRAMGRVLAECADLAIPEEFGKDAMNVVIVPLPTIGRHIRERGFDHTKTVAKKLARRRGWECRMLVGRAADTVQVGAKKADREVQAKRAYEMVGEVEDGRTYLLYDDVWTTGASMLAAAKVLREAGAKKVYGVVLAVSRSKRDKESTMVE